MTTKSIIQTDSHLFSYAFLKVNSNLFDRDYYDNFLPFVKEVLISYDDEIITATMVKQLLEQQFKIVLPTQVVNTLLRRLAKQDILKVENRVYKLASHKIDNNGFQDKRSSILMQHSLLISSLIQFSQNKYQVDLMENEAETAILSLIKQNSLTLIKEVQDTGNKLRVSPEDERRNTLIAANYIIDIRQNNQVMFNYLIEIIKGYMLLESIYVSDASNLDKLKMKFRNTEIYFDTSFLLYALGYSGPELQQPCLELLKLLKDSKAILRCFSHNIDEARRILEYIKRNSKKSHIDRHNTLQHFIEQGYGESDIDEIIFNLETAIKEQLKIQVIERVPYREHENVLGEQEIKEFLQKKMNYKNANAVDTDVASISAIHRIRSGLRPIILEECKALFVTMNYGLAKYTREYFNEEYEEKIISPVIDDMVLMNLVWLKNPQVSPNLQEILLMADCYAAMQPSEKLWKQYVTMLDTLADSGQIEPEKVFSMKYSQGISTLLSDQTLGNEELLTIGTIKKIQADLDKRAEEEKKVALETVKRKHVEEKGKLEAELMKASESLDKKDVVIESFKTKLEGIAQTKAKNAIILIYIFSSLLFIALFSISNWYADNLPSYLKILARSFLIFLGLTGILGLSVKPLNKKMRDFFISYYFKKLN